MRQHWIRWRSVLLAKCVVQIGLFLAETLMAKENDRSSGCQATATSSSRRLSARNFISRQLHASNFAKLHRTDVNIAARGRAPTGCRRSTGFSRFPAGRLSADLSRGFVKLDGGGCGPIRSGDVNSHELLPARLASSHMYFGGYGVDGDASRPWRQLLIGAAAVTALRQTRTAASLQLSCVNNAEPTGPASYDA